MDAAQITRESLLFSHANVRLSLCLAPAFSRAVGMSAGQVRWFAAPLQLHLTPLRLDHGPIGVTLPPRDFLTLLGAANVTLSARAKEVLENTKGTPRSLSSLNT